MDLTTDRLVLIEIGWDDLQKIHNLHSLPEVDKYNTLGIPACLKETKSIIQKDIEDQNKEKRSRFAWKVILKESEEIIGMCGMFLSCDRFNMAEFYYKLFPTYWGKGYATEIAKIIIEFGFKTCKLHRIEAGVATQNKASIRVLEKAGMTCEGIRRKILPIRGEWKDNFHYSILEDEYESFPF